VRRRAGRRGRRAAARAGGAGSPRSRRADAGARLLQARHGGDYWSIIVLPLRDDEPRSVVEQLLRRSKRSIHALSFMKKCGWVKGQSKK